MPPRDPAVASAHTAFHGEIGRINQPRIVPLVAILAALLTVSAGLSFWQNPGSIFQWDSSTWQNLSGVGLTALVYLLHRISRSPRLVALAYGYAILGWGNSILSGFQTEVRVRHADHAAEALVVYYVTRYLAAMTVVWRPRDLGLALALNHIVIGGVFYSLGQIPTIINTAVWTTTAWLGAYAVYRAERDAFIARASLQRERDELAKANLHLERLNQEKNDLMAIAAHDLRSPLMGMTTLLNIAVDDASRVWTAGVATLKALEQSGRDMADLVTRVLDVHQAEEGIGKLALVAADVRPIVNRSMETQMARAQAKDIALTVETPAHPCPALIDAHALGRVLDNLASNAIKFSPRGGSVRVQVLAGENGGGPTITLRDSGPGIREEDRSRMFRKFARLRARPTDGESSSGLGLYIVRRLVDAMAGTIAVSGGTGEGATFAVSLSAAIPARASD